MSTLFSALVDLDTSDASYRASCESDSFCCLDKFMLICWLMVVCRFVLFCFLSLPPSVSLFSPFPSRWCFVDYTFCKEHEKITIQPGGLFFSPNSKREVLLETSPNDVMHMCSRDLFTLIWYSSLASSWITYILRRISLHDLFCSLDNDAMSLSHYIPSAFIWSQIHTWLCLKHDLLEVCSMLVTALNWKNQCNWPPTPSHATHYTTMQSFQRRKLKEEHLWIAYLTQEWFLIWIELFIFLSTNFDKICEQETDLRLNHHGSQFSTTRTNWASCPLPPPYSFGCETQFYTPSLQGPFSAQKSCTESQRWGSWCSWASMSLFGFKSTKKTWGVYYLSPYHNVFSLHESFLMMLKLSSHTLWGERLMSLAMFMHWSSETWLSAWTVVTNLVGPSRSSTFTDHPLRFALWSRHSWQCISSLSMMKKTSLSDDWFP